MGGAGGRLRLLRQGPVEVGGRGLVFGVWCLVFRAGKGLLLRQEPVEVEVGVRVCGWGGQWGEQGLGFRVQGRGAAAAAAGNSGSAGKGDGGGRGEQGAGFRVQGLVFRAGKGMQEGRAEHGEAGCTCRGA